MSLEMRRLTTLIVLAMVLAASAIIFAPLAFCRNAKVGRPLTHQEVATTWVGLSEDELYLVRILLFDKGQGLVGYAFQDDTPIVFRVDSWKYDPNVESNIQFVFSSRQGSVVKLSGDVVGVRMELTISQGDWKRHVTLRRESDLERRWRRLLETMRGL